MTLRDLQWNSLSTYLFFDLKLSSKPQLVYALRSQFRIIQNYFLDKEFTRANYAQFLSEKKAAGYSASYMNNSLKMTKHIAAFLKIEEFKTFTYFKEPAPDYEILTTDEIKRLIKVKIHPRFKKILNERDSAIIEFLATTGCRIGELLNLKFKDVHQVGDVRFVTFRETKNGTDRSVPISKKIFETISRFSHQGDDLYVFNSAKLGYQLSAQGINIMLKKRAAKCKITKRIFAHLFRHSFISQLIKEGGDPLTVGKLVGHKKADSTLRYYHADLSYLWEIAQLHPLLKETLSFEEVTAKVKKEIAKIIDSGRFPLMIEEAPGELKISIKKA